MRYIDPLHQWMNEQLEQANHHPHFCRVRQVYKGMVITRPCTHTVHDRNCGCCCDKGTIRMFVLTR